MFTGLVEEIGKIENVRKGLNSMVLKIKAKKVLQESKIGDSIAVNGVCLTVTELGSDYFLADVMPKTYELTNLKNLKSGDIVNLERAISLGERLGGHIVQGHIDTVGKIISKRKIENADVVEISFPKESAKYVLTHGSISIDGTSLTVAKKLENSFTVYLIPTTQKMVSLGSKKVGEMVNLEFDIIGKYVENMITKGEGTALEYLKESANYKEKNKTGITEKYLIENGF